VNESERLFSGMSAVTQSTLTLFQSSLVRREEVLGALRLVWNFACSRIWLWIEHLSVIMLGFTLLVGEVVYQHYRHYCHGPQ